MDFGLFFRRFEWFLSSLVLLIFVSILDLMTSRVGDVTAS